MFLQLKKVSDEMDIPRVYVTTKYMLTKLKLQLKFGMMKLELILKKHLRKIRKISSLMCLNGLKLKCVWKLSFSTKMSMIDKILIITTTTKG